MNVPKQNSSSWKPIPLEILEQAKPADMLKHSLAKVEAKTLYPGIWKNALNSWYLACFEITNKFHRIKLYPKVFRFGMEHFQYPAIRG
ncbi:hypothetical protein T4A_8417 [Trichinella pseudospiralis]|uniref:Uncharacterized protein n=1 Tax=Trichinella pseudospiralis TaxID=6337 RepID=A0A0V1E9C4_TRIPS|nr:hypothetical protein T4A_3508 [Trichinella pseudospiralis]KRY65028.1 hypothetical protein T4A_8883 [Trichinella pseudospiralis]KRY70170.1 hypothetical protein T4A_8417 [Trichinella pseudospiralis]